MAYFSVTITGGEHPDVAGLKAREMFNGRASDYGAPNVFYVERSYSPKQLECNLSYLTHEGYDYRIDEIDEEEYNWRRHR